MTDQLTVETCYTGGAEPAGSDRPKKLPVSNIRDDWSQAEGYVASPDVIAAVNVAITLGRPLLVTGEPGTGKSDLAKSVAYDLGLGQPLEFVIKSDTESRDLFYFFDTVGRFHSPRVGGAAAAAAADDANNGEPRPGGNDKPSELAATAFITYNALGEAILRSNEPAAVARYRRPGTGHDRARRSVVLIDEVDKAPRDVPNDILSEIDRLEFEIPELSLEAGEPVRVKADKCYRPLVIITSNLEKSLPDAFLRRCVYIHVAFPEPEQLRTIVQNRLGVLYRDDSPFLDSVLSLFQYLRNEHLGLSKLPATAELLDWLYVLFQSVPDQTPPPVLEDHPRFLDSVRCTLLKNQADQDRARDLVKGWSVWRQKQSAASRG